MSAKQELLLWAKRLGVTRMIRDSQWRSARLLILCYHSISLLDEHEWNPSLYVTQEFLRDRFTILRDQGYRVLPLSKGLELLHAGTLPPRSVAITFDDGTVDFARLAVPLLSEFQFPATVYLTTYYSDVQLPVFDTALSYVLWKGRSSSADVSSLVGYHAPLLVSSERQRMETWRAIQAFVMANDLSAHAKDSLLQSVARSIGVDYSDLIGRQLMRIMSPGLLKSLPRQLVDIQLHTHRHRTPRVEDRFVREILDNRRSLEAVSSDASHYSHFCYPSGDYDGRFLPWLHRLGVVSATTCVPGIASQSGNPLLLPRFVDTMSQTTATFEGWLSGLGAMLPARSSNRFDGARLSEDTVGP